MENIKKSNKIYEICGEMANILCFDCISYYCDICSNFIHVKEINKMHKIDKIDLFRLLNIKCGIHPNKKLDLFCVDENSN